jgi:hypothetical protein
LRTEQINLFDHYSIVSRLKSFKSHRFLFSKIYVYPFLGLMQKHHIFCVGSACLALFLIFWFSIGREGALTSLDAKTAIMQRTETEVPFSPHYEVFIYSVPNVLPCIFINTP